MSPNVMAVVVLKLSRSVTYHLSVALREDLVYYGAIRPGKTTLLSMLGALIKPTEVRHPNNENHQHPGRKPPEPDMTFAPVRISLSRISICSRPIRDGERRYLAELGRE